MLELKTLTLEAIRSFDTKQVLNLSDRDKIFLIDGKSGHGKTTILLAIDYLLGINDIPSTLLQSRLTKKPLYVKGEFMINGKPLTIERTKKTNGLVVEYDGEVTTSSKLAEEKIDNVIGVPRKLLKRMIHKKQKERGFFLSMTAKDTYEFLIEMLDLENYLKYSEAITLDIKNLKTTLEEASSKKESVNSTLAQLNDILSNKTSPTCNTTEEEISALSSQVNEIHTKINELSSEKQALLSSVQLKGVDIKEPDQTGLRDIEQEISGVRVTLDSNQISRQKLNSELNDIENAKKRATEIGAKITALKAQKAEIESSTCPTCKQTWCGETAKAKVLEIDAEIKSLITEALNCKKQIDRKDGVLKSLLELADKDAIVTKSLDELLSKQASLKERHSNHYKLVEMERAKNQNEYQSKINEIQTQYRAKDDEIKKQLGPLSSSLSFKQSELRQYTLSLNSFNKEVGELKERIKIHQDLITDSEALYAKTAKQILIAEEALRLIKTYVLQVFQDTLDSIGDTATEILSAIPNMVNSTVYFENCKETKTGSIKDEVNAVLNVNGVNSIPIKSFSGGEGTVLDLAVDLAVIETIEMKTGKGAGFLLIDEPFDGLDNECKENYLEILKQLDINKQIIMVDHSPELKEMVSDVITICKNGESSSIN